MPVEKNIMEEEKTEVETGDGGVEEEAAIPNQTEEKDVDEDKEKVMRHFLLHYHHFTPTIYNKTPTYVFLSCICSAGG